MVQIKKVSCIIISGKGTISLRFGAQLVEVRLLKHLFISRNKTDKELRGFIEQ